MNIDTSPRQNMKIKKKKKNSLIKRSHQPYSVNLLQLVSQLTFLS